MEKKYAVALTTVSTLKQQIAGNSPDVQKKEIKFFGDSRNFIIVNFFQYTISRSKEDETIVKAIIEYCKSSKYPIKYLIFKCIDRFSRGGTFFYLHLKKELAKNGIECIDIYGIIQPPINTLAHLGMQFPWSMVSPSENAEILEANRAKQEVSTILTRMIGAEIGYRRKGYAIRPPKIGLQHKKITTPDGIRTVLEAQPEKSKWIIKMLELRAESVKPDEEIVDIINAMGYTSGDRIRWDRTKPTPVPMGMIKGKPLTVKQMQKMVQYTEYVGVICDRWTNDYQPIKTAYFAGLVSFDTFNRANRGKIAIVVKQDGSLEILRNVKPQIRNKNNPLYPYKEAVACPRCRGELRGSAPRSKSGKHIPYYHCNHNHPYWSMNRVKFHTQVYEFISGLHFNQDFIRLFTETVLEVWRENQKQSEQLAIDYGRQVQLLREERQSIKDRMKLVKTEAGMKLIEEDLAEIENKIAVATQARDTNEDEDQNIDLLTTYAKYFMEHLEELLIVEDKPEQQKQLFSLAFEETPTFEEIVSGTPKLACVFELNEQYKTSNSLDVSAVGVEPTTLIFFLLRKNEQNLML